MNLLSPEAVPAIIAAIVIAVCAPLLLGTIIYTALNISMMRRPGRIVPVVHRRAPRRNR